MFKRALKLPLSGTSSIFLFGPRGTGKTSLIKNTMPDALYLDLLEYSLFSSLSSQPQRLSQLIPPGYSGWVVIDEVQRVPELLQEVHRLIESRKVRFLLTGSSARALKRQGVNLLAGRALVYHLHPLIIQEIGESFDLSHALHYGLLPTSVLAERPEKYLESYASTYVREEVMQEGMVRNVGNFNRFLEIATFAQGNLVNFSEISRELAVSRDLVRSYFDIVEDLLLAVRIPVFAQRAKRKMVAHHKFYFFDAGVYRALRPRGPLDSQEELDGAGLETLFLQSLRAVNDYYELGYTIYFWRTVSGAEVDFVLYGPRGLHAFEIKRSAVFDNKTTKGLAAFGDDYPEAKLHLIFGGDRALYGDRVTAWPFMDALKNLVEILA